MQVESGTSPKEEQLKSISLATSRLRIRPLEAGQAQELAKLTNEPAIAQAVSFLSYPFTADDAARLIARNQTQAECFFGLWPRQGGDLIGVMGAHLRPERRIEVGYWIGGAHAGQGYTSEAATAFIGALRARRPDHQIYAECSPSNPASWRVLTKHGFVPTGRAGERSGRQVLELLQHH